MFIINNHSFGLFFFVIIYNIYRFRGQSYNFFLIYANKNEKIIYFSIFFVQKVLLPLSG